MESDGEDLDNIFEEYENNEEENDGAENTENKTANETPGAIKVAAPKRIVKNPRLKFNADRLCGERGIPVLVDHFKGVKFKGPGYEKEDLDTLLARLQHWTHRLFPSMKFADCLNHIERLGKKRQVQTCLRKIRLDMPILNQDFVNDDDDKVKRNEDDVSGDDIGRNEDSEPMEISAFDRLLGERGESSGFDVFVPENVPSTSSFNSSPVPNATTGHVLGSSFGSSLTDEQKERMERNRMLAAERRKARLSAMQQSNVRSESENHEAAVVEDITSKQISLNKMLDSSEHNEGNVENNASDLDMCLDFNEDPKDSSEVNCNDSEKLGLDDLIDLVDEEEDPVLDENRITSPPEQTKSAFDNVNASNECSLNDGDCTKNSENVSENTESKISPCLKNTEENLNMESSLDLICETSVNSAINVNADCSINDASKSNRNAVMYNKDLTSMDYVDEKSYDDCDNINKMHKSSPDDA